MIFITHDLGVVSGFCDRVQVMYAGRIVERATVDEVFREPKHPYNKALQRSIPAMQSKGMELYTIRGLPPDLSKPIPGCPFVPRCEFAREECNAPVRLETVAPGHESACTRVQQGTLQLAETPLNASDAAHIDEAFTEAPAHTAATPDPV